MKREETGIVISVVIPVYNCERYIRQCLDSVLGQTFRRTEVICVDDGSSDASLEILCGYALRDARVKILRNLTTLRAGGARNRGLEAASGQYVIFLDADDFFEPDMLEICYRQIRKYKAQQAVFYYDRYDGGSHNFCRGGMQEYLNPVLIPEYPVLRRECRFPFLFQTVQNGPWTKLIDRQWLVQTGIRFPELENVEDLVFSFLISAEAETTVFTDRRLAHYRWNEDGLTSQSFSGKNEIVKAFREVFECLLSSGRLDDLERSYANAMIRELLRYFLDNRVDENVKKGIKTEFSGFYEDRLEQRKWNEGIFFNKVLFRFYRFLTGEEKETGSWNLYEGCHRFEQLTEYIRQNHYRTALWGAGESGKQFLEGYRKYGADTDYVTDSDVRKRGTEFMGHTVCSYEDVRADVNVIFVTNPFWLADIIKTVNDPAKHYVSLYPMVEYGCDPEQVSGICAD